MFQEPEKSTGTPQNQGLMCGKILRKYERGWLAMKHGYLPEETVQIYGFHACETCCGESIMEVSIPLTHTLLIFVWYWSSNVGLFVWGDGEKKAR
jgi:hypothetical protein